MRERWNEEMKGINTNGTSQDVVRKLRMGGGGGMEKNCREQRINKQGERERER